MYVFYLYGYIYACLCITVFTCVLMFVCITCVHMFVCIYMHIWVYVYLLNTSETLLHSLERVAAGIGLHVNAHKTEYICFNQAGHISTLDGTSLKLVDKFTYLGSSVSSTEKDIDTRLTKAWTAIDKLSVIWKRDLADKMKRSFFKAAVVSILLYGCNNLDANKTAGEEARRQECCEQY